MQERELRAFLLVADTGRMDLAAKALGYSQPAISYQIKCLEQYLGAKLFDRNPTGARLTREGQMILPVARAVLMLIDSIKASLSTRVGPAPVPGGRPGCKARDQAGDLPPPCAPVHPPTMVDGWQR